jgi:recombination protein RecT
MANEVATNNPGTGKAVRLIDEWRDSVHKMEGQFKMALPAHIPLERFVRVVMTALQNNPKLMACSKQSVFNAAVRCAQDGLLPDGREAAIVPFGEEDDGQGGGRSRADLAGYMPMVYGIRKKIRNSGEIKDLHAHAVYEGDDFAYELGDEPYIKHKPKPGGRTRQITHVYSIAVFNDGTLSRDVMPIEEVEDIRKKFSRSRKGPWSVKESYSEMAIKTVVKHHAKSLPMSTDLDRLIHADDALYDLKGAADKREPVKPAPRPTSLQSAFDAFAADDVENGDNQNESLSSETDASAPLTDSRTESSTNQEHSAVDTTAPASAAAVSESAAGAAVDTSPAAAPTNLFTDPIEAARQRGIADRKRGMQKRAVPPEYRDNQALAKAWERGWETDK